MRRSFGLHRLLERELLKTMLVVVPADMVTLVRRSGVSRATVRRALHSLERRRFVRRTKAPGRGGAELWSLTYLGIARADHSDLERARRRR